MKTKLPVFGNSDCSLLSKRYGTCAFHSSITRFFDGFSKCREQGEHYPAEIPVSPEIWERWLDIDRDAPVAGPLTDEDIVSEIMTVDTDETQTQISGYSSQFTD